MAAICAFGFANAQDKKGGSSDSDMAFGVKGGLNVATLSNTAQGNTDTVLLGFHVGVFGEFKVTDKFAVQPEILFSTQGNKSKSSQDFGGGFSSSSEDKTKLGYLNIPVMAKFYVTDDFSIEAGPQIGFLMSAKSEDTTTDVGGGPTTTTSSTTDVKDKLNSVDFGLNFGLGYNIGANIVVGARYDLGLNDIQKTLGTNEKGRKNGVFQVSVG